MKLSIESVPAPTLDPEKKLTGEISELKSEIDALQKELAALENTKRREIKPPAGKKEEKREKSTEDSGLSRRSFLKILGAAAVASAIPYAISRTEKKVPEKSLPETPKPRAKETPKENLPKSREQIIREEIAACKEIIEKEKCEEVLAHPYLVSALYYTGEAIEKISKDTTPQKEIITAIYPSINKSFREKYMRWLQEIFAAKNLSKKENSRPVEILDKGRGPNHPDAVDLFIKEGAPTFSMTDGVVVLAENGWKAEDELSTTSIRGGNTVIIFNPYNKKFYRYAHLEKSVVAPGTVLESGKQIGLVGHTGLNASKQGHGGHIHFEINGYDPHGGVMVALQAAELALILSSVKKKSN